MKLTVIIPCYNEEKTINELINKVINNNYENKEIIIIDDCSTDKSKEIIGNFENKENFKIIYHEKNMGKGSCIKSAIKEASGEICIIQDADLEYDPNDFVKFSKTIKDFEPDLIIGSRFNYADYSRSHYYFNKIGNKFITLLFNLIYNTTFTDIYSCYACFKKSLILNESLKTDGFEQHAEILCKVVKNGKKFYEVPINYNGRSHEDGKKIKFYHIFSVIYQILVGKIK